MGVMPTMRAANPSTPTPRSFFSAGDNGFSCATFRCAGLAARFAAALCHRSVDPRRAHEREELGVGIDVDDQVNARFAAIDDRMRRLIVEGPRFADLQVLRPAFGEQKCSRIRHDGHVNADRAVPLLLAVPMRTRDAVRLRLEDEGVYRAAERTVRVQQGRDVRKLLQDRIVLDVLRKEVGGLSFVAAAQEQDVDGAVDVPVTYPPRAVRDGRIILQQPAAIDLDRQLHEIPLLGCLMFRRERGFSRM